MEIIKPSLTGSSLILNICHIIYMKTKAANIVKIDLPAKGAFTIPTDPDFIKLHTLMVINGKRGGGKTLALCNFLKEAKSKNYYDRIFVITPTYNSNKETWDLAGISLDDTIEPSKTSIKEVLEKCEDEKREWDEFLGKKELYKKFKNDIRNRDYRFLDGDDVAFYDQLGFLDEGKPKWKYPKEQPPRLGIVLDDCLNTDVMASRNSGLTNLCIRHRHILDGLGVSVFMLVQSYCAIGGVPRTIRENTTHLLLFKINDEKQIQKIKEESDLEVTDEEFQNMLHHCHSEDFQFMMIDFSAKCPTKKYRKGFNEYIIPPSLEGKCKCKK